MNDQDSTTWFDRRQVIKGTIAGVGALALPTAAPAQDAPR